MLAKISLYCILNIKFFENQSIIREIFAKNNCILLTEKSITNTTCKLLFEKSLQTKLRNYYQRNDSKQFLQAIRKIISNNSYKLLLEK